MEVSLQMTKVLAVGPTAHAGAIFPRLQEDGVDYVTDECKELLQNSVLTTSGKTINFDYCVVCSGLLLNPFQPLVTQTTMEDRKVKKNILKY